MSDHLLIVDLASVRFRVRAGRVTADLPDGTVLANVTAAGSPQRSAAAVLTAALEGFTNTRLDPDGQLVVCRLALYNPFTGQVEAPGRVVFHGGLVELGESGTLVEVANGRFVLDGHPFTVADRPVAFSAGLTRALAAHA